MGGRQLKQLTPLRLLCKVLAVVSWVALMTACTFPPSRDARFEQGLYAFKGGDHERAFSLLSPLAHAGHTASQFYLGKLFSAGEGNIAYDLDKAVIWYAMAANQNHAEAQFILGTMFEWGTGVPTDLVEAAFWHGKAAEQGHASAQIKFAALLHKGHGLKQNSIAAYMWIILAMERLDGEELIDALSIRDTILERLTATQRATARKMARHWKSNHPLKK